MRISYNDEMGKLAEPAKGRAAAGIATMHDPECVRAMLVQSLWLQRLAVPKADSVAAAIRIALRLAARIDAMPPLGFLADLHLLLTGESTALKRLPPPGGYPSRVVSQYEHQFLGRVAADTRFDHAAAAVRRYSEGDRPRAVAFVAAQLIERLELPGAVVAPSAMRMLATEDPETLLQAGLTFADEPSPIWLNFLETAVAAMRRSAIVLAAEDVLALEHRMALAEMRQYVAHRQLLEQAAILEASLPTAPIRARPARSDTPTSIPEEDQYPVGGYASIGTRGSIESLLHSQLTYMDDRQSPDLFDAKLLRDELFYYTRDENRFRRRRRTFGFYFDAGLRHARVKDPGAAAQRLVLAGALVIAAIRRLSIWLGDEALEFDLQFHEELAEDSQLFENIFHAERQRGTVNVAVAPKWEPVQQLWTSAARRSEFRGLLIAMHAEINVPGGLTLDRLILAHREPQLVLVDKQARNEIRGNHSEILRQLLDHWL